MLQINDFNTIVIISDNIKVNKETATQNSIEFNKTSKDEVDSLSFGFKKLFQEVIVYDNISEFMTNIKKHKNDIIFPYWHGELSRNRQGLIPAICEVENLIYVGPDSYSNIICCDKVISKDICRINDLAFPKFQILYPSQTKFEWKYNFPAIVKPIYEGFSVGISQKNIVFNDDDVLKLGIHMAQQFDQPIVIEEFIPGKEISVAIIGTVDNIKAWGAIERYHISDENFLDTNLIGFGEKLHRNEIQMRDARNLLTEEMLESIFGVFKWLDKVEYIRIDGKIWNDQFWCIELSNDMSLSPEGGFFKPLSYCGLSYDDCLRLLIENCLERYENQFPNQ